MSEEPLLDRSRIEQLFTHFGERLQRRGIVGDRYAVRLVARRSEPTWNVHRSSRHGVLHNVASAIAVVGGGR